MSRRMSLLLGLVGVLLVSMSAMPARVLADEFMTGMMFMPSDTWKLPQIDHMNWMRSLGFNYMEPECIWLENGLSRWKFFEPQDDVYNWFGMDHYVDDARKAGIRVFLDPTPFGFQPIPDWLSARYPDIWAVTPNGASDELVATQYTPSLAHPGYRQAAKDFFTVLAARYKDDPTVAGIILGNERGCSNSSGNDETYYGLDYSDAVRDGFHQFLASKYGTVAAMNTAWGKSYASFNDVNWKGAWITSTSSYRGEWLNYCLYREKFVADFYRALHDGIKSVAPNMTTVIASLPSGGWQNGRHSHGCDPASMSFVDLVSDKIYQWPDNHDFQQIMVDFWTGITGKPYFCVNLGTNNQTYDYPLTPQDTIGMFRQTWELLGRGGRGYLYWFWNEPLTAQLAAMSLIAEDTAGNLVVKEQVYAFSEGAKFVHKYDKFFLGAAPHADNQIGMLDPDVTYIQLNPTAMNTSVTRATWHNQLPQYQQWESIATVLVHENYKVNHLSEAAMLDGRLDKCSVLVLAGTEYLYATTAAKIEQWMATPGRYIVMTSNAGLKDELGRSTTWKSSITANYGSRIKILSGNYVNQTLDQLLAKTEVQSLYTFLASRTTRKCDVEGLAKRGDVTADMLRYKDPATGKRTDMVVLVNRKVTGNDLPAFTLRVSEDCHYEAAYIFDPWHNHQKQTLAITRSGGSVRVPISGVDHVRLVMLTEDPAVGDGEAGQSPGLLHETLSAKARWWDALWTHRIAAQFYSAEHTGTDIVARAKFTTTQFPELSGIDPASVRVVEYDRDWNMRSECQCTARIPAAGQFEVFWKMPGATQAATFRNFYIYAGATGVAPGTLVIPQDGCIKIEADETTSRSSSWWLKRQLDGFGGKAMTLDPQATDPAGYYLNYTFSVSQAGSYNIHIRNHGGYLTGYVPLVLDDLTVQLDTPVLRSGQWTYDRVWKFLTVPVANLTAGTHTLRITVKKQAADFTIDYIKIAPTAQNPATPALVDATWTGSMESSKLISDTFNTSATNGNINLEYDTGRQSGRLAPLKWVERPETIPGGAYDGLTMVKHPWGGQNLCLLPTGQSWGGDATRYIWVAPDHSFIESGKLKIEVEVDPYANGSQPGTNWAAVILGTSIPGTYGIPTQGLYSTSVSTGVSLMLSTDGAWTVYDDGSVAASGNVTSHTGYYSVKIETDGAACDGSPMTLRFYIDGSQVHSYVRSGGLTANYITLAGLGLGTTGYQTHFFDNFSVTRFADSTPPASLASPAGGAYHWGQNVELVSTEPGAIFYTLDGSQPTTASPVYITPIPIASDTTLRFFAVDTDGNAETPSRTETYTFDHALFADNFTPAQPGQHQYDINLGHDFGRQSGALAPIPWGERPDTAVGGAFDAVTVIKHPWGDDDLEFMCTGQSWGSDATKYIWASPQHNFTESGNITIDCDIDPFAYPSVAGPTNWAALILGTYVPGTYAIPMQSAYGTATSMGVGFTLDTDGAWSVYSDDHLEASGTVASPHAGFYHVRATMETAAYDGSPALLKFYVDGVRVHSFTKHNGFHSNYITLAGLGTHTAAYQDHFFDNFVVTGAVDSTPPVTSANPPSGLYQSGRTVTLTANEPATIYYTLDGSEPMTSSSVYSNPILISGDRTLRFFAVDSTGNVESPKKLENYEILDDDGSIAAAKLLDDGSEVELCGKVLYYKGGGFGYIEEPDRTCGIRIEGIIVPDEHSRVCVSGTVQTTAGGERFIAVNTVTGDGSADLPPVGVNNRALESALLDGLHVTCWGIVKSGSIGDHSFVISDGSGDAGVLVIVPGTPNVSEGQYAVVSGAAGFEEVRVIYSD